MNEKISLQDTNGKRVSGHFEVRRGTITVTASDGRKKTAEIDEAMLSLETHAKSLLLQLHRESGLSE
jgi:hypothetical protein